MDEHHNLSVTNQFDVAYARRIFVEGYAILYPNLDPRKGLLGLDSNHCYIVEKHGNTLIPTPTKFQTVVQRFKDISLPVVIVLLLDKVIKAYF